MGQRSNKSETDSKTNGSTFHENIILKFSIIVKTGLSIGGSLDTVRIGGVNQPIIRTAEGDPYIPGSSLKGKMRHSIETLFKAEIDEKGRPHATVEECKENSLCPVCVVFGSSKNELAGLTRLLVRDALLKKNSEANSKIIEIKEENFINRLTGSADAPRSLERVVKGIQFSGELVYSIYQDEDYPLFRTVFQALQFVEDTSLGGSGSRGSGKVEFKIEELIRKTCEDYIYFKPGTALEKEEDTRGSWNLQEFVELEKIKKLFEKKEDK